MVQQELHVSRMENLWHMQAEPAHFSWPSNDSEFRTLLEAMSSRLVWHAFRRLRSHSDAEDVVQDVFLRVYSSLGKAPAVKSMQAYLYRMTTNACIDFLRKRDRRGVPMQLHLAHEVTDDRPTPREIMLALEETERLEGWLRRIPRRQAEIIRLHLYDELCFSDAADVVGCSAGTAKSRFRNGMHKLKRLMDKESPS